MDALAHGIPGSPEIRSALEPSLQTLSLEKSAETSETF